ncbi:MAG: HDIG domain-containing protein [Candidatus Bathyarchaeota archaeon]|nr:HDIG domain-containing protein [Candidatus Bathyarchaeota archaeon]MDH5712856.1 HDIG domain-containing protein [Candidatus Bathyarchaeota archaeon]
MTRLNKLGDVMLTREEALNLIKKNVMKRNIVYHMLAVEAIMRSLAKHSGEDEQLWGLTGLLHDIDYGKTEGKPEKHSILAEEILKELVPAELIKAIKAHNFQHTHIKPETRMEKALIACDAISGLLVACALVMPSKKLADVKVKTVMKKFKDKDFARGANRERMLFFEEIGIPREKFFEIALNGLRNISSEIGL